MRLTRSYSVLLILLAISPVASAFPLDWNFSLVTGPDIFGLPGETVGWGYEITNNDELNWLVTASLDAGSFLHATPFFIFDFPILAPLQSVFVPYDPFLHVGLYEVELDAEAPLGFVNDGIFTLTSDFWDGDPFGGGQLLFPGLSIDAPYSVTVGAIPEPSHKWVFALITLCALLRALRISAVKKIGSKSHKLPKYQVTPRLNC